MKRTAKPKPINKGNAMRERAENKGAKAVENLPSAAEQTKRALADVTGTITDKQGQKDNNYRQ